MIVWVLESGCYSSKGVAGVYATVEAAIADCPVTDRQKKRYPDAAWHESEGFYSNGCYWDDALELTRYEVQGL